jgi:hypothetical protein
MTEEHMTYSILGFFTVLNLVLLGATCFHFLFIIIEYGKNLLDSFSSRI